MEQRKRSLFIPLVSSLFCLINGVGAIGQCPVRKTKCTEVKDWNDMETIIESAKDGSVISLCSFSISKAQKKDPPLLLENKKVELVCAAGQKCEIGGRGRLVQVGDKVQVAFASIIFKDSTDSAVTISSVGSVALFCDCSFTGNSNKEGGAARIKKGVGRFESCQFSQNRAKFGGAIFVGSKGRAFVHSSSFEKNEGTKLGGAIYGSEKSKIDVSDSTFTNNKARKGPVITVVSGESWSDRGKNIASGHSKNCDIFLSEKEKCLDFGEKVVVDKPTIAPTPAPPPTPKPTKMPDSKAGFFNYDPNDTTFGLPAWERIKPKQTSEYLYWIQYEKHIRIDLNANKCKGGNHKQSPIKLSPAVVNTECLEYHEIRDKPGNYDITDPHIVKEIQSNKLRLKYSPRDPKKVPPHADIPSGWGHHLDVLHVDVKPTPDHVVEEFGNSVAEFRIYHIQGIGPEFDEKWTARRGAGVVTMLMTLGRHNAYFQRLLDAFIQKFSEDHSDCPGAAGWNSFLNMGMMSPTNENISNETQTESEDFDDNSNDRRTMEAEEEDIWDPYKLMTSPYFYGYWGSDPEPPCYEFFHWRILDKPMEISYRQLAQLRRLVFEHRDPITCEKTSADYEGSVSRPLQPLNEREIHKCTCSDYLPDKQRKEECRRTCDHRIGQGHRVCRDD